MRILTIGKLNIFLVGIMMMAILLCWSNQARADQDGDYTYTVTLDGEAKITKYTGSGVDLNIPDKLGGYSVTSIGAVAFQNLGLNSVIIPNSVTSIGGEFGIMGAFAGCTNLTNVTIPESVTSIGNAAFMGCSGLTSVTIPSKVTVIAPDTFSRCTGLTTISIPSGVTSIGWEAFWGCKSLTTISIPPGVTSIGSLAFYSCQSLTSLSIPSGVTSIDNTAFMSCTGLISITVAVDNLNYTSIDGLLFNKAGTTLLACPAGLTSVIIPPGTVSIYAQAFQGCTGLTTISVPQGVTDIGSTAFGFLPGLTSIAFNSATTTIYDSQSTIPATTTIIGYDPSTAKDYATKYSRTFLVLGATPGAMTISMSKPAYTTGENIIINWTAATNTTRYGLSVWKPPYFTDPTLVFDKYVNGTSKDIGTLPAGIYAVNMNPYNDKVDGPSSNIIYFTVIQPPPIIPGSMTVSVKATFYTNENVVINWTRSTNADKYGLSVWKAPYGSDQYLVFDQYVRGTSQNIGKLPAGSYCVAMKPYNSAGAGPGSNVIYFKVVAVPVTVTSGPVLPVDKKAGKWYGLTYPGHDVYGAYQYSAIDINLAGDADNGQNVYAIEKGVITFYDSYALIKHSKPLTLKNGTIINEWYTMYGHIAKNTKISNGASVNKGEIIGTVSHVGADNNHLHFVIFRNWNNSRSSAISPYWLPGDYNNSTTTGQFIYADDQYGTRDNGGEAGLYENRIFSQPPAQ